MSTISSTNNVNNAQAGRPRSQISVETKNGKLHLYATDRSDHIKVTNRPDGMVSVQVNNQKLVLTREQAANLVIHAGDGNDSILLDKNLPKGIRVEGEGGRDAILNFATGAVLDGGSGNDCIVNFGRAASLRGGSGNDILVQFEDQGAMHGGRGRDVMVSVGKNNVIYGRRGEDFVADPYGRNTYRTERRHGSRRTRRHRSHRHHRRHTFFERIVDQFVDWNIGQVRDSMYEQFFPEQAQRRR